MSVIPVTPDSNSRGHTKWIIPGSWPYLCLATSREETHLSCSNESEWEDPVGILCRDFCVQSSSFSAADGAPSLGRTCSACPGLMLTFQGQRQGTEHRAPRHSQAFKAATDAPDLSWRPRLYLCLSYMPV